jgi:hypothetical protein
MKMEIILKETISKTRRGERASTTSMKEEFLSLSSTQTHLRFLKYTWQTDLSMWGNKKMVLDRALGKPHM